MIDEKTHMWYTLSGKYGDLAWEMLEDFNGKKISYKRANKYLEFIMKEWPPEEVCRTVRTWMIYSDIDTNKLNEQLQLEFRDKYHAMVSEKQYFELWAKPSKS